MSDDSARARRLNDIDLGVRKSGYFLLFVGAAETPRYAYTIGLSSSGGGPELVFAGAAHVSDGFVIDTLSQLASGSLSASGDQQPAVESTGLGAVSLHDAHPSWTERLLLAAVDYAGATPPARQVRLADEFRTIDVPSMEIEYVAESSGPWQWARSDWPFPIDAATRVLVNLRVLYGEPARDVSRWRDGSWQATCILTPEDEAPEQCLRVPIATLVGADPTLVAVLDLQPGHRLGRDSVGEPWQGPFSVGE